MSGSAAGRGRKRDANEAGIVRALRDIGCTVRQISGEGVPDLAVYSRGVWRLIEVKMPGRPLKPAQQALYVQAPFPIVHTEAEALALFGVMA